MAWLRRKQDPALDGVRAAFGAFAAHVDAAQRALLGAIPTARDPGVPLEAALNDFHERLTRAEEALPGWRDERVVHEWTICRDALAHARAAAGPPTEGPRSLGFEALNARVGDVLHPLESVADVERALRRR